MPTTRRQSLEREIKFRVDPDFTLPRLRGTRIPARAFTSTYYDTDSYQLVQHGLTLRYRTKAQSGNWQLKLPVDGARLEVEFSGDPRHPPEPLTRLLEAHLRGESLKPIARVRTHRRGVRMRQAGGVVADVTMDRVDVLEGKKTVRHFSEVEAELIKGKAKALRRIEKVLRKAGARKSDQRPKVFEALGLAFPVPELVVSPALPPIECLKGLVQKQVKQILVHDVGTRLGTDAEDVHRMRVASRRIRALLRAARPLLAIEWAEQLRQELAWLGDSLGTVRDLDVLLAHVRHEKASLPPSNRRAAQRVVDSLQRERAVHCTALLTTLQSQRYLTLLQRIEAAGNSPVVADSDVSLDEIARSEFKKLRRAVRQGGDDPSDAVLHRIRIKGRRARYAAELGETQLGKPAERFIRRVRDLQDLLGEHQDALVAERQLRKQLAERQDRASGVVLRRLIECQGERRSRVRDKWPKAWARVKKSGQAAWG